jgi:DNA gyrase/topoisomerase IV subunit B
MWLLQTHSNLEGEKQLPMNVDSNFYHAVPVLPAAQDHDGSHIKGLIMNFLHTFYPSLLKVPGFLVEFITPIIKVSSI